MKKSVSKILLLLFVGLFLNVAGLNASGCISGGVGQSSCSVESETTVLGFTVLKFKRSVEGCPDGTYACCKAIGSGCKENPE